MPVLLRGPMLAGFFAGVLGIAAFWAYQGTVLAPDAYRLFDWLISYQAGFVRRGLAGEGVLALAALSGLAPEVLVWAIQTLCYGILFGACLGLLLRLTHRAPFLLLVYCPAVFLFPIADWQGGFRKEILFLALLAALAWAMGHPRLGDGVKRGLIAAALTVYPALILSHEMLALFLPYLVGLAALMARGQRDWLVVAALLVPSGLALVASLLATGGPGQVQALCAHLAGVLAPAPAVANCAAELNAITWLARDTGDALRLAGDFLRLHVITLPPALVLIALGLVPLRALWGALTGWERRWLALTIGAGLLASLPLFVVALDWGRLIHIHLMAGLILCLVLAARAERRGEPPPADRTRPPAPAWAVGVYLLGWNLAHTGMMTGPGILVLYGDRLVLGNT